VPSERGGRGQLEGKRMSRKLCNRCENPAEFSICFVVSTVGRSPRNQKCTETLSLCTACIQNVCGGLRLIAPPRLAESLQAAYTTFTSPCEMFSDIEEWWVGRQPSECIK
jgi:hypothetical protein